MVHPMQGLYKSTSYRYWKGALEQNWMIKEYIVLPSTNSYVDSTKIIEEIGLFEKNAPDEASFPDFR